MKTLTYPLVLLLLHLSALSQKQISPQAWQHPIIKQLQNKAPHLVQLNRKKDADYYIPIAILNKQNNLLYYVTTFGEMFDSVAIGPKLSKALVAKQIDAFETYNKIVTTEELKELAKVRNTLREYGLESDKKSPRSNYINYDYYKSLTTTFEKTITLDTYEKTVLHNNILLNLIIEDRQDQAYLVKRNELKNYKGAKIKIHQTKPYDYIEFTNQNAFALLAKAYFYPHSAKVYLHNRLDKLVDSFTIKKEKAKEIETEKQDIFALHRMWQEWQLQQTQQEAQALLKKTTNKTTGSTQGEDQLVLNNLLDYYNHLQQKIFYSIAPDKDVLLANIVNQAEKYSRKKWMADSGWVVLNPAPTTISSYATLSTFTRGEKEYFLTDHRGNVYATVSDRKIPKDDNNDGIIDYYVADVVTASDYAPFGSLLQSRQYRNNGKKLNYGYNGKENDNEVKGEGLQLDYGFRIYDPRLGRFLSVDPLTKSYPWYTPYQFAGNKPINSIDVDGLEDHNVVTNAVDNTLTSTGADHKSASDPTAHGNNITPWKDLLNFKPSNALWEETQKRIGTNIIPLNTTNQIQHIEAGNSTNTNFDYYAVKITELPKSFKDGEQLFEYIRSNLGSFLDDATTFSGYSTEERKIWDSKNPLGSVLSFDAKFLKDALPSFLQNWDDASVMTSSYYTGNGGGYWTFTTLSTRGDGEHPIAGTRQFGLVDNKNGSYTFYTRGVDRTFGSATVFAVDGEKTIFESAEITWSTVMNKVFTYINHAGGNALLPSRPISKRVNWDEVKKLNKK